jgi:hypothetical protein
VLACQQVLRQLYDGVHYGMTEGDHAVTVSSTEE